MYRARKGGPIIYSLSCFLVKISTEQEFASGFMLVTNIEIGHVKVWHEANKFISLTNWMKNGWINCTRLARQMEYNTSLRNILVNKAFNFRCIRILQDHLISHLIPFFYLLKHHKHLGRNTTIWKIYSVPIWNWFIFKST